MPVAFSDVREQLRALGLLDPPEIPGDPLDLAPLEPTPGAPLPSAVLKQLRADER